MDIAKITNGHFNIPGSYFSANFNFDFLITSNGNNSYEAQIFNIINHVEKSSFSDDLTKYQNFASYYVTYSICSNTKTFSVNKDTQVGFGYGYSLNNSNFTFSSPNVPNSLTITIGYIKNGSNYFNSLYTQSFTLQSCNTPPTVSVSNAIFPNITFQVTDDKSVSKVDVILNNNIKDTITNNLDKALISNFTREELTWGENIVTIRATDSNGATTDKQVKIIKDKITVPASGIQIVKNNKIYKVVSTQETPEELIIELDRDLEDVSSLSENIEILNDYATVSINNKQMQHISSRTIANNEVEDKFVLDEIARQVTTRVDLYRHDINSNIYIRELQEAFQYNED